MNRRRFLVGLLLAAMTGVARAADKPIAQPAAPSNVSEKTTGSQVVAYYFHGSIRCETCQKIERLARLAIEQRFPSELAGKRLVFDTMNYDRPENRSYADKFKLTCPSLVLIRRKDSKDVKWKLLGETWELIENPAKFSKYVESEVEKFLRASGASERTKTARPIQATFAE